MGLDSGKLAMDGGASCMAMYLWMNADLPAAPQESEKHVEVTNVRT